jgi:hypothetical protein
MLYGYQKRNPNSLNRVYHDGLVIYDADNFVHHNRGCLNEKVYKTMRNLAKVPSVKKRIEEVVGYHAP